MSVNFLHILLRAECKTDPGPGDVEKVYHQVLKLIDDIGMKVFMDPKVKHMPDIGNVGLTWVCGLETSHGSFHAWTEPDPNIMKSEKSTLIQFDIFTCGCLGEVEIKTILNFISEYDPKLVNLMMFDRSRHDSFDTPIVKIKYNKNSKGKYSKFVENLKVDYTNKFKKKFLSLVA